MSLTSFVQEPAVRAKLRSLFPDKPRFEFAGASLLVSPRTKNYSRVGTAFDYLTRFYLEHLNPFAAKRRWVAERGRAILEGAAPPRVTAWAADALERGEAARREVCESGCIGDVGCDAALRLALLDSVARSGRWETRWFMDDPSTHDVADLQALTALLPHHAWLVASKRCLLNPTFGIASSLVGGADGDLVVDDMIVEIKSVMRLRFTRDIFNQMLGYLALHRIGGFDGDDAGAGVAQMGVYYSRYGVLASLPIEEYLDSRRGRELVGFFKSELQRRVRTRARVPEVA